ncbi:MAG TPA: HEAT repeat domain-containing protein [Pyrinomonadaceae bacterium]|nr:HEAT repeat domain-containing protein [Pyrinomonadaceae bacterium]
MDPNGHSAGTKVITPEVKRLRASGPILILAVLFVGGAFLSWYFSWFGRSLSDEDISQYLVDEKKPRHVQHALLQVQQRIERGDANAQQWYPQIIKLSSHPETEFRLTAAWLMGFDPKSEEFHRALITLLNDPAPIVRRNAALALVRFGDARGRPELLAMLKPYEVQAPVAGKVASTLKEGAQLARGTLLARITETDGKTVEVRSPLPGKLERILTPAGSEVTAGTVLATINSDEDSVWEGLRGLALIGEQEDLPFIERYVNDAAQSDRVKQQAAISAKAIQNRSTKTH